MLFTILIILYVVVCISLVVIVLLQSGKGGGLSGIFGSGGGGQTIFGARAGDVMTKSTTVLAVCFMLFSLVLAVLSANKSSSMTKEIEAAGMEMPVSPETAAAGEEATGEFAATVAPVSPEKTEVPAPQE
ncbi:MAG: preprotein translocase subunit SecG [Candidatus Auribacterota bacterium]|nr:preprotein translocase subunit SecG [Candidatus Auribacterota bacterium]